MNWSTLLKLPVRGYGSERKVSLPNLKRYFHSVIKTIWQLWPVIRTSKAIVSHLMISSIWGANMVLFLNHQTTWIPEKMLLLFCFLAARLVYQKVLLWPTKTTLPSSAKLSKSFKLPILLWFREIIIIINFFFSENLGR